MDASSAGGAALAYVSCREALVVLMDAPALPRPSLRTHFSAAFIESLYPELKKGGKAVAEDEDEDEDVNDPTVAPPVASAPP